MIFAISASPIFRVICNLHLLKKLSLSISYVWNFNVVTANLKGKFTLFLSNFHGFFADFRENSRGIGVNRLSTVSGIYAAVGVPADASTVHLLVL